VDVDDEVVLPVVVGRDLRVLLHVDDGGPATLPVLSEASRLEHRVVGSSGGRASIVARRHAVNRSQRNDGRVLIATRGVR
jgi:hypothetical protein